MIRRFAPLSLLCFSAVLPSFTSVNAQESASRIAPDDFAHKVAPLLKEHCGECHTGNKKKGGFSMNTRAAFLSGGENGKVFSEASPHESRVLEVLFSKDPDTVMPPPAKDRKPPTQAQLDVLKGWILSGAKWEDGYAFQKPAYKAPLQPRLPSLPPVTNGNDHPLDRLLSAYNESHGLKPATVVDDAAFARRVYLDLVGILPEVKELELFVADKSARKREALVDALLSRKTDYADHWLTFWNDLLRNDYGGTGFITGGRKQVSSWLYQALLENAPYDQMVRELVNPSLETEGFSQGITWRGTVSASQTREVQFSQSVSQSFLGLNFKCASCHDSFIDDWKLSDAYGLAAIYSEKPIEMARCEKPTGVMAQPSWPFPELGQIVAAAPRAERLKQLAELMTHRQNGWFARTMANRLWAALFGRGLVHPVDSMGTLPWSEDILDYLGWYFAQQNFDMKAVLRLIATSRAYQTEPVLRSKEDATAEFVFRGPRARRMSAEQFVDAVWRLTNTSPTRWDAPVRRGDPDGAAQEDVQWSPKWIVPTPVEAAPAQAKGKAPVTIVSKKLSLPVKPTKASGIIAAPPNTRVFANGGELKGPQANRFGGVLEIRLDGVLAAGDNVIAVELPPQAPSAARQPVLVAMELTMPDGSKKTLISDDSWQASASFTAEQIKAGKLSAKAPEFQAAVWSAVATAPESVESERERVRLKRDFVWALQTPPPARAALMKSDILMRTLGRPNRDQIVTSRPQDLSTLEALDLSAGERLNDLLSRGAGAIAKRQFPTNTALVQWVYSAALSRMPSKDEEAAALEMLGAKPSVETTADFLWAVCVQPEFQLVR